MALALPQTTKTLALSNNNFTGTTYTFYDTHVNTIYVDNVSFDYSIVLAALSDPNSYILVKNNTAYTATIYQKDGITVVNILPPGYFAILFLREEWITYIDTPESATSVTATNIGTGAPIYAGEVGGVLEFKSLAAGGNIIIVDDGSTITISTDTAVGEANTATNIGGNIYGLYATKVGVALEFKNLEAGTNIFLSSSNTTITINAQVLEVTTIGNTNSVVQSFNSNILTFNSLNASSYISLATTASGIFIGTSFTPQNILGTNVGVGAGLYSTTITSGTSSLDVFKSIIAQTGINITDTISGIYISSPLFATTVGNTNSVLQSLNSNILTFNSLNAGSYVNIATTASGIFIGTSFIPQSISGTNVGVGAGLYSTTIVSGTESLDVFKSIIAQTGINITDTISGIYISSPLFATTVGNTNSILQSLNSNILTFNSLNAGSYVNIATTASGIFIGTSFTPQNILGTNVGVGAGLYSTTIVSGTESLNVFKSIIAQTGINITDTISGIYISSPLFATTVGNTNSILQSLNSNILTFNSLNAGSYVSLATTASGIFIGTSFIPQSISGTNVGVGAGLYSTTITSGSESIDVFKSIIAQTGINITDTISGIYISSPLFATTVGNTNSVLQSLNSNILTFNSLNASSYINIATTASGIFIGASPVSQTILGTNVGVGAGLYSTTITSGSESIDVFKSIIAQTGISISDTMSGIYISSPLFVTTVGNTNSVLQSFDSSILVFNSLNAGSYISLATTASGIFINNTVSPSGNTLYTNIGGTGVGLYATTVAGASDYVSFKSLIAGTNVTLQATESTIIVESIAPRSTYLTYFPFIENSQTNFAAIDLLNVNDGYLKAFPIIYDSVIRGIYLSSYYGNVFTIPPGEYSEFQFGVLPQGATPQAINFTPIAPIPLFTITTVTVGSCINVLMPNLSIPVTAGSRLALQTSTSSDFHGTAGVTSTRYIMTVYLDN